MSLEVIESIDKKIILVEFLTHNIVQIRELCRRVWFEVAREEDRKDMDRLFKNVDASFQKTTMDEKCIALLLVDIYKDISELNEDLKPKYVLIFEEKKISVANRLQESYFKYKED